MSTGRKSTDEIIADWIAVSNSHDTAAYLSFFTEDTTLDDTSVGEVFEGHEGLRRYFETYVVGYNTQTKLVSITPEDGHSHVVVDFTGTFPEGQIGGYFDITLTDGKISFMQADLL
jgi:ketosteroid isomerase-like protein